MFQIPGIILLLMTFLGSFFITFLYKNWATRKAVLDIPNERSSHSIPTPRGGGIAIVISFYLGLMWLFINGRLEKQLFLALLPGLGLSLVGIIDDIKSLGPLVRIICQFVFSGLALFFLGGFESILSDHLVWLWSMLALVGFVWFINVFNFLDGSDGYASMEAISVLLALWFFTGLNVILVLVFSIGGFLCWNWPKAKIFMGDVGSTTLGYLLIVFGVYFHNHHTFHFFMWFLIAMLFGFDATITLIRRIINGEKLYKPHRNHIYQRAIQGGFSHRKTMLWGFLINISLFFICYIIWKKYCPYFVGLLVGLVILFFVLKYVDHRFAFKKQIVK